MNKIVFFVFSLLVTATLNAAFLIQEHCDDDKPFDVSSAEACEKLCPNRKSVYEGGASYAGYLCIKKEYEYKF